MQLLISGYIPAHDGHQLQMYTEHVLAVYCRVLQPSVKGAEHQSDGWQRAGGQRVLRAQGGQQGAWEGGSTVSDGGGFERAVARRFYRMHRTGFPASPI